MPVQLPDRMLPGFNASAVDCLERLVSEATCYVLSGTVRKTLLT